MRCGHKNAQSYALAFCLDPEITIKLHRRFKITIGTLQNHWRFVKALQNVHEDSSFFFQLRVAHGNIAVEMSSVPSLCYCAHTTKRLLRRQNLLQRQKCVGAFLRVFCFYQLKILRAHANAKTFWSDSRFSSGRLHSQIPYQLND